MKFIERVKARINLGWCQGSLARDVDGVTREPWSPRATKWCLMGAIYKEDGSKTVLSTEARELVSRFQAVRSQTMTCFNDLAASKEDVLRALDELK